MKQRNLLIVYGPVSNKKPVRQLRTGIAMISDEDNREDFVHIAIVRYTRRGEECELFHAAIDLRRITGNFFDNKRVKDILARANFDYENNSERVLIHNRKVGS